MVGKVNSTEQTRESIGRRPAGLEGFGQKLDKGDGSEVTKDLVDMYVVPKMEDYIGRILVGKY